MSDLIKRSDAIKAVLGITMYEARVPIDTVIYNIKSLPSADRPQGEWICHKGRWIDLDYYPTKYECDQCHHYVDVASDKNYCPNCGADMRKGADDE